MNQPQNSQKKSSYTIWLLVLTFAAPVILAYIMFFFGHIDSYTNHGEILKPIIQIKDFNLTDKDKQPLALKQLTYKWRLISFLGKSCDKPCQARLHDIKQIHISLGKNRHRVIQMVIHVQPADAALQKLLVTEYPKVTQVYADEAKLKKLTGQKVLLNNTTYIMDPMGNVMMRFTADQPDKDFLTDLKKLLKASQIG